MAKNKFGVGSLIFVAIIFTVLTFLLTSVYVGNYYTEQQREFYNEKAFLKKLSDIDSQVKDKFFFDIDNSTLEEMIMKGYVAGLNDQFSYYLTPEEANMQNQSSSGEISGIGIYASFDTEHSAIYISGVMPNSPAEKAGLLPGDLIIKVGDLAVNNTNYNVAIYSVPGEPGTQVSLTIARFPDYKKEEIISITREKFVVESVTYEMLDNDIAYIKIAEFNDNTDEQFVTHLNKAKNDGAKGIIFDVRNNPGGNLESVCNILDPLLPKGPIVHIINKENEVIQSLDSDARFTDLPMVVLINRNTASGGELFCSALRDYEMAALIGEKTFGKGCMQTVYPLSDGSMLILTTNLYNPPKGENYHGIGVEPSIKIQMTDEMMQNFNKLTREEDIQFQEALREITERISNQA